MPYRKIKSNWVRPIFTSMCPFSVNAHLIEAKKQSLVKSYLIGSDLKKEEWQLEIKFRKQPATGRRPQKRVAAACENLSLFNLWKFMDSWVSWLEGRKQRKNATHFPPQSFMACYWAGDLGTGRAEGERILKICINLRSSEQQGSKIRSRN